MLNGNFAKRGEVMTLSEQFRKTVALRCAAIACVVLTLAVGTAYGQTFTVLHNFNDGADGATRSPA